MRHTLIKLMCSFSVLWAGLAQAQTEAPLLLSVNEGSSSSGLSHSQAAAKYQWLADLISHAAKTKVNLVFTREFEQLDEGMRTGRFDFVMARPSDYPARAIRDYSYSYVSSAKPDGRCLIVVPKDSPLKTLADIKGKRIAMPSQAAYMSHFCTAELKKQGIALERENVNFLREQGAVVFYLESKLADVGAISSYSKQAAKWEQDGNRVLHKSVAQPYFPLVASKKIRPEQIKAVQAELLALSESEQGKEMLNRIGIERFDTGSEPRLRELLKWLHG